MNYRNSIKMITLSLAVSTLIVGCGSGGSDSTPAAATSTTVSGVAVDPELQGATVFLDKNQNGFLDTNELNTTTDNLGKYSLNIPDADIGKPIIVTGGVDRVTRAPFTGKMSVISESGNNSQHITPITTLVQKYKAANSNISVNEIKKTIAGKLGVNDYDLDKNFVEEENKKLLKIALRLQKVAEAIQGHNSKDIYKIYDTFAYQLKTDGNLSAAIGNTISKEVADGTLAKAKIVDLDKEIGDIDEGISSTAFALTVENVDDNISKTTKESDLNTTLATDSDIFVDNNEVEAEQGTRIVDGLGFQGLDQTSKDKIYQGIKDSNSSNLDNDSIRKKFDKGEFNLDASTTSKVKREQLFNDNGLQDLDKPTKDKLKTALDGQNFDFANAKNDDFRKKLQDFNGSLFGGNEDFKAKVQGQINNQYIKDKIPNGVTNTTSLADGKLIVGSIIKGPIDGAVMKLKDSDGTLISSTVSDKGIFAFPEQNLTSDYYTIESSGGSYEDEATKTVVNMSDTQGLKTYLSKAKLEMILANKEYVAITPETTIYTDIIEAGLTPDAAKAIIKSSMIDTTSPLSTLQGDDFLQVGDFTTSFPKDSSESFARNRAISFSYMVRDLNQTADKVFELIDLIVTDLKDGTVDGIDTDTDGTVDLNITQEFASARKKLFQNTTTKLIDGKLSDGQKAQLKQMGIADTMDAVSSMGNTTVTSTTLQAFNYVPYSQPLAIPALAAYTIDAEGYKVFNLDINQSTTEFFQGVQTVTYGINSSILGQTIRMHNGDKIKLNYNNNLSVATTMHGHGMHVPALMDGGPINKIQPGTTWSAQYTVDQRACTNWYHPHFMHKTAEHVQMGLAGMIIIDDAEMDALNLPKEYGVDDIPLVLQGKRFDSAGQIDYSPTNMEIKMGYKSDIMLANGVINPFLDAPAKKVRFRVLNGSNARVYNLKFKSGKTFQQIGVDNSLLEKPVTLSSVNLTPGERAEIIVDFSQDLGSDFTLVDGNSNLEIMQVKVNSDSNITSTVPDTLTTLTKLDETSAVRTRKFVLNMAKGADGAMHMAINGKLMDMARIDEVVPKDDVEIWEITNMMGMTHNFHIHATHFFPLTRNGAAVDANEQGYKDVISMPGKSTMKVIVKMTDFVDDNTGYMYHCHFLEHEDDGMMGQFSVTDGAAVVNVGGTSGGMGNGMNNTSNQNSGNTSGNMGNGMNNTSNQNSGNTSDTMGTDMNEPPSPSSTQNSGDTTGNTQDGMNNTSNSN